MGEGVISATGTEYRRAARRVTREVGCTIFVFAPLPPPPYSSVTLRTRRNRTFVRSCVGHGVYYTRYYVALQRDEMSNVSDCAVKSRECRENSGVP